ncbi:hypothetical protein DCC85_12220 [Paenibacillus sp. CAA11]|nr:hypothetical protein DCC85_12220 [Paenibacillus sp. CAA11]
MQAIDELIDFTDVIYEGLGITFEETNELERQVISAFCFGAVNAIVQRDHMAPHDAHALMLSLLIRKFAYSPEQAAAFTEDLIQATNPDVHQVMNAIIHRGIDGHRQYVEQNHEELRQNITEILITLQSEE